MTIRRIKNGPRMSQAVVYGGVVYLAGQVSPDPKPSVTEQVKSILTIVDELLAEAGTDKSRLLTASIWLTDISTFDEMNAVWDAWVSPGNTPARATVGVLLARSDLLVEIAVTAAVE